MKIILCVWRLCVCTCVYLCTCPDKEEVNDVITKEQWTAVARQLGDSWKKLASELRFSGEDISDFEALPDTDTGLPAAKMIYLWQVCVEP